MTLQEQLAIDAQYRRETREEERAAAAADDDARQAAIDGYKDTEIEIDLDAEVNHASGGAWVAAWVWVSTEEIDAVKAKF